MSNQKFDHPAYRRLVTGTSGTGKTTLWMDMIAEHEARYKFIYDVQGEYAIRNRLRKVCKSMDDVVEAIVDRRELIVFDPIEQFPGKCGEGFTVFCDLFFEMIQGDDLKGVKLLAADELQMITDNRIEPMELLTICETGRRYQADVLVATHAPNRIHNAVRNQFTWVATFRQSDKRALEYLVDQGFDADQVRNLNDDDHAHLWKDLKTGANNFGAGKGKEGTSWIKSDTVPAPKLSGKAETDKTDERPENDTVDPIKAAGK